MGQNFNQDRRNFLEVIIAGLAVATTAAIIKPIENVLGQEADPSLESSEEITQYISQKEIEFGDKYLKAKNEQKTKEHYENSKRLGNKDAEQKIKDLNIKGKENQNLTKKITEEYSKYQEETARKIIQIAAKKDEKNEAEKILFTLLLLNSKNTEFDKELQVYAGWVQIDGKTYSPEIANSRLNGKKKLENSNEGQEEKNTPDCDLVKSIGINEEEISRRRSNYFLTRTTYPHKDKDKRDEIAKKTHKILEATYKHLFEYLGIEGSPFKIQDDERKTEKGYPHHRITIFDEKDKWEKYRKTVDTADNNVHEFWRPSDDSGLRRGMNFLFSKFERVEEDRICHGLLEGILYDIASNEKSGGETTPWLFRQFIYLQTWQVLGTTLTKVIPTIVNKYGTRETLYEVPEADKLRAKAYNLAKEEKMTPVNKLINLEADKFTIADLASAWAATEYMYYEKRDKMKEIFAGRYKISGPNREPKVRDVEKITGQTAEEFNENSKKFALRNYVTLRNHE